MVVDLINDVADMSDEVFPQVFEIYLCGHSWFGMRDAADEVALHFHRAVYQSFGSVTVVAVQGSGHTLGEKFLTDEVNGSFQ